MAEKEKERRLGRYAVKEHTARRLVVEEQRRPLVAVGLVWAVFVLIALVLGPWRGGTPLYVALASACVVAVVSLLLLRFVPRRQGFAVDVENGEFQREAFYFLLRAPQVEQVEMGAVAGVCCRRQLWRDMPGVEAARWIVEIMGPDLGWRLAEGEQEVPMRELARLVAEVSGRPLSTEE